MEQMVLLFLSQQPEEGGIFQRVVNFLAEHDIQKMGRMIRQIDWQEQLYNPELYLVSLTLMALLLWKGKFRLILALLSLGLFIYLLPFVLPQGNDYVPLRKLVIFAVVTLVLVVINLYFLLIRRD
jgi:hypothetical protein